MEMKVRLMDFESFPTSAFGIQTVSRRKTFQNIPKLMYLLEGRLEDPRAYLGIESQTFCLYLDLS